MLLKGRKHQVMLLKKYLNNFASEAIASPFGHTVKTCVELADCKKLNLDTTIHRKGVQTDHAFQINNKDSHM